MNENNLSNSLAFLILKPLCMDFARDCSIETINALENAVKTLDSGCIELFQEFIIHPFIVHLKENPSEKIAIKCIDFLTFIFKKSRVKVWQFFYETFLVLFSKISNVKDMNKLNSSSEEVKISVCECILCLVCNSTEEILNEMYSMSFRPYLASCFFVFNVMLREERSKILLKAVLDAMGGLTYNTEYFKEKYRMTGLIASEALGSCLPGLSIALYKVICGDDKQSYTITIIALNILTGLMILTMEDESYERDFANDSSSEVYVMAYKSGKLHSVKYPTNHMDIPVVIKNKIWFKTAAENLEFIIKSIAATTTHNHWKVRLQFLKFSESLLCKCNKTLENCIAVFLSTIFELSVDSNEVVSSSAKETLNLLSKKLESMNHLTLNTTVEENIQKLVSQLITCKFSGNDNKKLSILKSLLGYIEISGLSLNKLVYSPSHLKRIILTLLTLLEFNISEVNSIEEMPVIKNFDGTHLLWPKKRFKFFESEEVLSIICRICYSLGHIGNFCVLIDYLLEKLSSDDFYTLQCIFIIGNIIKGLSAESEASKNFSALISDVLEVFLSPSLYDVPLRNDVVFNTSEPSTEVPLSNNILNKNKLQVCLLLEGIANCSECLKADFRSLLMKVLCPVMEKAGSFIYIISQCGRICLYKIAAFCTYKSVQELIKDNADYITNLIMIHIHQYLHKPEISVVLCIALEYSDAEAIVLFRDLIIHILDLLDYNQDKAYSLMHVLLSVVTCIKKWFPSKKYHFISNTSTNSNFYKNLKTAVKDYTILKQTVSDFESESIDEEISQETAHDLDEEKTTTQDFDINVEELKTEEMKPQVPLHVNIICEIFKRCVNLQSSKNEYLRMLILDTVELCILALRDHEQQLHPLVHQFWSPFLRRFTEDTFITKAFNVLLTIANECGDFIRSRTLTDVLPKLVLFLRRECSKSHSACNFKSYQWTSEHSLQILLLSEIGNLCGKLNVDDKDVNAIIVICLSYLKKEQPEILQNAAVKSLKALAVIDPDAVWFYWNVSFSEDSVLMPPCDDFLKLSFPYCDKSSSSVVIDL